MYVYSQSLLVLYPIVRFLVTPLFGVKLLLVIYDKVYTVTMIIHFLHINNKGYWKYYNRYIGKGVAVLAYN